MKSKMLHIVWILFFLVACIGERSEDGGGESLGSRGKIDVEILVRGADEHDFVRTAEPMSKIAIIAMMPLFPRRWT